MTVGFHGPAAVAPSPLGRATLAVEKDAGALPVEENEPWKGHDVTCRQVTQVAGSPAQCMAAYGLHTTRHYRGRLAGHRLRLGVADPAARVATGPLGLAR